MKTLTFGSLFSGIGGIDLGFERAGMECIWQCEIEPYCRKVLAKHWPQVTCHDDVRTIDSSFVRPDVLCGGFPCQPHSLAGKRQADKDPRDLWPECDRLVDLFRPDWCVFENVPGIRTTIADQVIEDLEAKHYTVWPLVVGADDIGASHQRKRVWFVAHSSGERAGDHSVANRGCGRSTAESLEPASLRQGDGSRGTGRSDASSRDREGMADPRSTRLERDGSRSIGTEPQLTMPASRDRHRFPARPGRPQFEWEAPRLVKTESRVGEPVDGLSRRMARRRVAGLKALGNAVVPQVAELIARAIVAWEGGAL